MQMLPVIRRCLQLSVLAQHAHASCKQVVQYLFPVQRGREYCLAVTAGAAKLLHVRQAVPQHIPMCTTQYQQAVQRKNLMLGD